jgi:DNA polymerase-3 subunit beta
MKFTCTQENLVRSLGYVAPIAGRNTQLPILQYVLLQTKDNTLYLTTTDLEVGVHTVSGGKMEAEGSCAVPARRVLEYVQQLPNTHPLTLETKTQGLSITTKGFKANFPIMDSEDFPLLPEADRQRKIELDPALFTESLGRVVFAAAREETRPEIRSVFLKAEEGRLWLAATDSFRLAEEVIPIEQGEAGEFSLLLPLTSAQEVIRLFSTQGTLTLLPQDNYITFVGEGVELSSRLIDGSYPDYQQIIPTNWQTQVLVVRSELVRALKTLTVFLPRDSRRVRIGVEPQGGNINLKVEGSEAGSGEVALTCEGEGQDVDILLNIQYILDGISRMPGDKVCIEFGGTSNPVVFRPQSTKGYTYIVMPIQA